MEPRKRPYEGDGPVSVKRRAIVSNSDSPIAAVSPGTAVDEPQPDEELEVSLFHGFPDLIAFKCDFREYGLTRGFILDFWHYYRDSCCCHPL